MVANSRGMIESTSLLVEGFEVVEFETSDLGGMIGELDSFSSSTSPSCEYESESSIANGSVSQISNVVLESRLCSERGKQRRRHLH